jgi:hypothetical protein
MTGHSYCLPRKRGVQPRRRSTCQGSIFQPPFATESAACRGTPGLFEPLPLATKSRALAQYRPQWPCGHRGAGARTSATSRPRVSGLPRSLCEAVRRIGRRGCRSSAYPTRFYKHALPKPDQAQGAGKLPQIAPLGAAGPLPRGRRRHTAPQWRHRGCASSSPNQALTFADRTRYERQYQPCCARPLGLTV